VIFIEAGHALAIHRQLVVAHLVPAILHLAAGQRFAGAS
jgi:hypothetical protein